jgi:hypothetical protein
MKVILRSYVWRREKEEKEERTKGSEFFEELCLEERERVE